MRALSERRRFPRAYLNCHLEIDQQGARAVARVADISERGACLRDLPPLSFDDEVQMTIPLPTKHGPPRTCRVLGHFTRQGDGGVGVRFLPLRPADMLRLRDYVWRSRLA